MSPGAGSQESEKYHSKKVRKVSKNPFSDFLGRFGPYSRDFFGLLGPSPGRLFGDFLAFGPETPSPRSNLNANVRAEKRDPHVPLSETRPWDVPDKNFLQGPFSVVSGMSRALGRDVPGSEKLFSGKKKVDQLGTRKGNGNVQANVRANNSGQFEGTAHENVGFRGKRARKFTRTSPRTSPWNFITMLSAPLNEPKKISGTPAG